MQALTANAHSGKGACYIAISVGYYNLILAQEWMNMRRWSLANGGPQSSAAGSPQAGEFGLQLAGLPAR